jgi:tetratricopeptide (TPR) repeat protein
MKPDVRISLMIFLLAAFLGSPIAQQDAPAQKLNPFTEKGLTYFKNGDYRSSVLELRQAVEMDPEDAFAWFVLGISYGQLRAWKEAAEAFRKTLTLDPHPQWGKADEKMIRAALAQAEQNANKSSDAENKKDAPSSAKSPQCAPSQV